MAETAPMTTYAGAGKQRSKVHSAMSKAKKKRKATTGGTKHVVASGRGSL